MHSKVAVAYVPVLHAGYRKFFDAAIQNGAEKLYLVGKDMLNAMTELEYIGRKDYGIRALPAEEMKKALEAILPIPVDILDQVTATLLQGVVLLPREDVSMVLAKKYFKDCTVDTSFDIFLRWHRDNTLEQQAVAGHRTVRVTDFERACMQQAIDESGRSFDWWRQIGAVLVKDGEIVLCAHNTHMPCEQSPAHDGDPRSVFKKGIHINISTAAHAEEIIIGEAARYGIKTEGASLYVTEFPCPYCARLIVHSGIKKCYFSKGYAVLDGETLLKDAGVELVLVDTKKEQG